MIVIPWMACNRTPNSLKKIMKFYYLISLIKKIDEKIFFSLLKKFNNLFYTIFLNLLLFFLRKKINFINTSYNNYNNNSLTRLCEIYKSDKGSINHNKKTIWGWKSHTYSNYYFSIFNHFKDSVKLVFECGIGTNNPNLESNMSINGKPGASLKVWKKYFKNAKIYGADIDKNILFEEKRIKTYYVDQLNTLSIKAMWKKIGIKNFDIIIDDGLHTADANTNFFLNSFDKMKKNGIYIIEDVHVLELYNLMEKLKKFNPELVVLEQDNIKYQNNNLIIIRKD